MDSVTFLERLNYFSPFGRVTWDRGHGEAIQFAYASGAPPLELLASDNQQDIRLRQDLSALAAFPQVSLRSGKAHVQRAASWEAAYHKKVGARTYSLGAYAENVSNAAVTLSTPDGPGPVTDLLPNVFSDSWVFNAGNYHSIGYVASVTQDLGNQFEIGVAYGSGGALTAAENAAAAATPDELRASLRTARRQSVTTKVSGVIPGTGTQFATSYQWASVNAFTPAHLYLTQSMREGMGWDIRVRQPLPGHLEATADLRNLLAQGYVPVIVDGRRMYLMHNPRALRGGVSFIF
jgi:hypothetical protein